MKIRPVLFAALFCFGLALAHVAVAEDNLNPLAEDQPLDVSAGLQGLPASSIPRKTPPMQVAMIYHKLNNLTPDFLGWSRESQPYEDAEPKKKDAMLVAVKKDMMETFAIMSDNEPINLQIKVVLGPYDAENKRFEVTSFTPETAFYYDFYQRNYAVIPINLVDYRYIGATPDTAEKIEAMQKKYKDKKKLIMLFQVRPDPPKKAGDRVVNMYGKPFRLVQGNLLNGALLDVNRKRVFWEKNPGMKWEDNTGSFNSWSKKNELIGLKEDQ